MVLTAGQWKSGHSYMNCAYSRAVEEWTQIYEWCLQQGSRRVDRYMNGAYSRVVEEWTRI